MFILAYFNDTKSQQTSEVAEFIDVFHDMVKFFKKYETPLDREINRCWIYSEYLKINDMSLVVNLVAQVKKLLVFEQKYQGLINRIKYDVLETLNDAALRPFLKRAQSSLLGISGAHLVKPTIPQKIIDFASQKNLENNDANFLRLVWFLECMEINYEFRNGFNQIICDNLPKDDDFRYPMTIDCFLEEFSTRLVWHQLQEPRMQTIKDWIVAIYNSIKVQSLIESHVLKN